MLITSLVFVGRHYDDGKVLAEAYAIEQATNFRSHCNDIVHQPSHDLEVDIHDEVPTVLESDAETISVQTQNCSGHCAYRRD